MNRMPFGSKYEGHDFLGARRSKSSHVVDGSVEAAESKKAMKVAKDYDSVKNAVMEGDGQVMHNKSQTLSNLKKPLPKGARK
jgi:hypothetical protein